MLHGVVYCITNKVNGMKYVGSTVQVTDCQQDPLTIAKQRNQDRLASNEGSPIARAQRELGEDNFTIEVLENLGRSTNREELVQRGFELEAAWIAKLNTFQEGYNCSADGKWKTPSKGCTCVQTGKTFTTCQEAANWLGRNVSVIFDILSGKQHKSKREADGKYYSFVR